MPTRRFFALVAGAALLVPLAGHTASAPAGKAATPDPVLVQVVNGDWRTPEACSRSGG